MTMTPAKVRTAIVGSYPKPRYIYPRGGRALLDSFGFSFDCRRNEVGPAEFTRLLDKAALTAIRDQNRAGIDIVTDGEERRGHYVMHILGRLGGIDIHHRKPISMRGGTAVSEPPSMVIQFQLQGADPACLYTVDSGLSRDHAFHLLQHLRRVEGT